MTLFIVGRRRCTWAAMLLVAALGVITRSTAAQAPLSVSAPRSLVLPNYDRVPIGQHEGIEGGAFIARTNDAGAGWYNPAGLALHATSAVNASATAYEWTRLTLTGLGNTSDRAKLSSVGTFFGVVLGNPLLKSDKWRFGFSVTRPVVWAPSALNESFNPPGASGTELFGYSANVEFTTMTPAVTVGYAPRGVGKSPLRFGLGLAVAHTSLTQTLAVSDRVTTPATATTRLRSFSAEGSVNNGLVTGGVQWDVSSRATLGLRLVSPGFSMTGSSRLALEGSDFSGASSGDVTFRDEEATFSYKLPLEVDGGFMFRFSGGEVEVDVRYYGSVDRYAMYESDSIARITQVIGTAPPTNSSAPYATTYNTAQSVTNVSVGGNYHVTRAVRVHAGFSSDASPVPSETQSIFTKADLLRVTSGISFAGSALSGSIGLAYTWGEGDRRSLGTTAAGLPAETQLQVKTFNLIYALSYAFGGQ